MLKKYLTIVLAAMVVVACGGSGGEQAQAPVSEPEVQAAPAEIRVEGVGFATPESVLHDEAADVYLVANINGSPTDVDGNGFISRMSPDGEVLELKWIDGESEGVELDAPKGMAIVGDTLYVADISVVRQFDRVSGAPMGVVDIPGGTFVNDLAATRDGGVLVSDSGMKFTENGAEDTGSAAVYLLTAEGELVTIATENLDKPNGVLDSMAHDGVVVGPYGSNVVYKLDEDGERVDLIELPTGGFDGLMETAGGDLLVSSWDGSAIYRVKPDGSFSTAAEGLQAPADFAWDSGRGVVVVPLFTTDAVVILAPR
jgi:hypothetical protein